MTQCPECGARNSADTSFCVRCGSRLNAPPAPTPSASRRNPSALLDEAAEMYAAGRLNEAADACHAALDIESDLPAARSLLGMVEEDRGNLSAALAEYEAVLRLEPARTAERERADRVRARLADQQHSADDDDESPVKRYMPVIIGVGTALAVLVIGAILVAAFGGRKSSENAGLDAPPFVQGAGPSALSTGPVEPRQTVTVGTGLGATAGPSIGPKTRVEAQEQSGATTGVGTEPGRRRASSVDPIPIPPVTTDEGPPSPLVIPGPAATSMGGDVGPMFDTPAPSPGPVMEQPRGKVHIWVGEDADPGTTGSRAPSNTGSPHGTATGSGRENSGLLTPSRSTSGSPSASVALHSGRQSSRQSSAGAIPSAARSNSGGSSPSMASERTGTGATSSRIAPRPVASSGSSRGASRVVGAPGGTDTGGASTSRTYTGGAPPAMPSARAGNPSTAPPADTGPASTSPAALRAQAAQAGRGGRSQEARKLYQEAIQSYRADSANNPGRAAANQSAVQSCQRALQALDASQ